MRNSNMPGCAMAEPRMPETRRYQERDDGMCGNINSYKCDDYPIGMAYVPWQTFQNIYDPERALDAGTMFVELDNPFYGRRAVRR